VPITGSMPSLSIRVKMLVGEGVNEAVWRASHWPGRPCRYLQLIVAAGAGARNSSDTVSAVKINPRCAVPGLWPGLITRRSPSARPSPRFRSRSTGDRMDDDGASTVSCPPQRRGAVNIGLGPLSTSCRRALISRLRR